MRVLIVPNTDNARAVEAARSLSAWLSSEGHDAALADADAVAAGLDAHAASHTSFDGLDLAVALGGDGTILKAVHLLAGAAAPILGVNLGRLGFLCGADGRDVAGAVGAALAGEGVREHRCTLEVRVASGGRAAGTHHALNEAFVGRGPGGRAVEMSVEVGGDALLRAVCDGMIVSTPTGSTAYGMSAGGPLVSPALRSMVLIPVCAHALAVRPVVLAEGDTVALTFPDAARAEACMTIDGDPVPCRSGLDRVEIALGARDVTLVRLDGRGFYSALRDTFFGG